jgi:hypothetical protein
MRVVAAEEIEVAAALIVGAAAGRARLDPAAALRLAVGVAALFPPVADALGFEAPALARRARTIAEVRAIVEAALFETADGRGDDGAPPGPET